MNFKYTTYNGFVKYCLGICRNREYEPSNEEINYLYNFESIVKLLYTLEKNNIIEIYNDIFENIIKKFINNPSDSFNSIKYMLKRLEKVCNKELNYYYFITSLNSVLNIKVQFTEKFIYEQNLENLFYPKRLETYIIKSDSLKIYGIKNYEEKELEHFGIYFIYDDKEIKYIGKSTNSVITRSFQSVKERHLIDFSKIEYRYPKTKSDVAIYEAYYIAKYKPERNTDMVFEDSITVKLPELDVSYVMERDSDNCISEKYQYYEERVVETEEFIKSNNMYICNDRYKEKIEKEGIYTKHEAHEKIYEKCLVKAKNKNLIIFN